MHKSMNRSLGSILLLAAASVLLAGCQPSTQNKVLAASGLTAEDPQFYPSDNYVRRGKLYYKQGSYGLAEEQYRKAVEVTPGDVEAWIGLAASYDQLRRFDLADQAYDQVAKYGADNAIALNNVGYSQLMRGNLEAARKLLLRAYELDPGNPYIANNLALLGESNKKLKRA
jgi:Flp pilus assembly protein TadD